MTSGFSNGVAFVSFLFKLYFANYVNLKLPFVNIILLPKYKYETNIKSKQICFKTRFVLIVSTIPDLNVPIRINVFRYLASLQFISISSCLHGRLASLLSAVDYGPSLEDRIDLGTSARAITVREYYCWKVRP